MSTSNAMRDTARYAAFVESHGDDGPERTSQSDVERSRPVRGPLSLTASLSTPTITAGNDFSIFVTIQNPYDVPVTLYDVQTHLPVELVDVNAVSLRLAKEASESDNADSQHSIRQRIDKRRHLMQSRAGIARAVGTDFSPEQTSEMISSRIQIDSMAGGGTVAGVLFNFPENPSPDELDAIMRRWLDFKAGVVAARLEPGDSLVRQFRLRTKHWLFFTPLTHSFQIQALFAADNVEHTSTTTYPVSIRATMPAVVVGGLIGAILGSALNILTQATTATPASALQAFLVATLATLAVVIGFARKTGSQSFISIEDFWGGALIGISVGFVGYGQFMHLFGGS